MKGYRLVIGLLACLALGLSFPLFAIGRSAIFDYEDGWDPSTLLFAFFMVFAGVLIGAAIWTFLSQIIEKFAMRLLLASILLILSIPFARPLVYSILLYQSQGGDARLLVTWPLMLFAGGLCQVALVWVALRARRV